MSRSELWMPLYVGDYLRDTTRLTTEQHGAYLLLIIDYWTNGNLPDDDQILAQITRLDAKRWRTAKPILASYFTVEGGFWSHKRIEQELEKRRAFAEKQQANGKKGGRPKGTQTESQKKPSGFLRDNPDAKPQESLPQSHTPLVSSNEETNGGDDESKVFWDTAKTYIGRDSKNPGSLIGKWLRDHGKAETAKAITAAQIENAVNRVQYVEGYFRRNSDQASRSLEMPC